MHREVKICGLRSLPRQSSQEPLSAPASARMELPDVEPTQIALLIGLFAVLALLYSSVGHGGASGYLTAMALIGMAPDQMKPTALILNLFVASTAMIRFSRGAGIGGTWKALAPFVITSVPCAFIGGGWSLDPRLYKFIVAAALVIAATRLAFKAPGPDQEHARPAPLIAALFVGALIGLFSGLIGVGGGIFLSPVLLIAGWATARQTAAMSAAFILINSSAALIGFIASHGSPGIELGPTGLFIVAVFVGGFLGSGVGSRRFSHVVLRRMLAVVLLLAAVKLVIAGAASDPGPDSPLEAIGAQQRP